MMFLDCFDGDIIAKFGLPVNTKMKNPSYEGLSLPVNADFR